MKWQRQYWGVMKYIPLWFLRTELNVSESPDTEGMSPTPGIITADRLYLFGSAGGAVDDEFVAIDSDESAIATIVALNHDGDLIWEKHIIMDESLFPGDDFPSLFGSGAEYQARSQFYEHPTQENHLLVYLHIIHNDVDDFSYIRWLMLEIDEDGDIIKNVNLGVDSSNTYDYWTEPGSGVSGEGLGAEDQVGGIYPISNGDVWVHVNSGYNRGYVALLDYSSDYLSTAYSIKIDDFDTSPESETSPLYRYENEAMCCVLSDGETLAIVAEGQTAYDPAVIATIDPSGNVVVKDFIYDVGGTSGDDQQYIEIISPGDGCFYTALFAGGQAHVLTKWSNAVEEQWTVYIQNWRPSTGSAYDLNIKYIEESPDGNYVYVAGRFDDKNYGVTLDITDGSIVDDWRIGVALPTGLEETVITDMRAGSDYLFFAGYTLNNTGAIRGYCAAKVPQKLFDQFFLISAARGVSSGKFGKGWWAGHDYSFTDVNLTINTRTGSKSAWSLSPSDATSEGLIKRTDDNPATVEYERTFTTNYYWEGH